MEGCWARGGGLLFCMAVFDKDAIFYREYYSTRHFMKWIEGVLFYRTVYEVDRGSMILQESF